MKNAFESKINICFWRIEWFFSILDTYFENWKRKNCIFPVQLKVLQSERNLFIYRFTLQSVGCSFSFVNSNFQLSRSASFVARSSGVTQTSLKVIEFTKTFAYIITCKLIEYFDPNTIGSIFLPCILPLGHLRKTIKQNPIMLFKMLDSIAH